jgi:hypothetical protein
MSMKHLIDAIPGLARIGKLHFESGPLAMDEREENKHHRAENGQFGSGSGSEARTSSANAENPYKSNAKYNPQWGLSPKQNILEMKRAIEENFGVPVELYRDPKSRSLSVYKDGKIHLNQSARYWKDPAKNSALNHRMGILSTPSPMGIVYHEIARHKYDADDNFWQLAHQSTARKNVSKYAAMNPKKFISEVYAGIMTGIHYDDNVMRLFDFYAKNRAA